jgi:hypothetical protein
MASSIGVPVILVLLLIDVLPHSLEAHDAHIDCPTVRIATMGTPPKPLTGAGIWLYCLFIS